MKDSRFSTTRIAVRTAIFDTRASRCWSELAKESEHNTHGYGMESDEARAMSISQRSKRRSGSVDVQTSG